MTIEELITLYPNGKIQQAKGTNNALSLPIDGKYFVLDKALLRETEIHLLKSLFPENEYFVDQNKHPWFGYLFDRTPLNIEGTFRIIQFQLKKPKAFLQSEWETSIEEIFPNLDDFFFISENDGALIEKYEKNYYKLEELQSIFLTLDADFDSSTTAFIGNFFPANEHLPALFKEEQQIFQTEADPIRGKSTFSLPDVVLHYFTKDAMNQSQIVQTFAKQLVLTSEIQQIILALWRNQGNISSTSKDLYMHRNTLHYRLEKFYEQTGLSLKRMDDLVFCYLLITK
ncbi:Fis family transcriptional regulator [Enterococcus plantarum]|uniref:Fis family transcriptional regulator n=1 Tax=Enterococcus plantarum TaxID=1077675 RepID=A0A2W4A383_9ENTE|nr:helix-turn-helix domain-containing protein [Enterococcus plantarum]PZL75353.1 Fis family transcriptional regulator [Enterococcus plantarum]